MKTVKKIASFICAFSMVLMSTSCNENKGKHSNSVKNSTVSQQCVYNGKDTGLVEKGDILIDLEVVNDKITFTKVKSEEFAQINVFNPVTSRKESYDFDLSDFEDGLSDFANVYSDDGSFYLVNRFNDETVIYDIDKENLKVSSVTIPEIPVSDFCTDDKGVFYLSYYVYDIQNKSAIIDVYSGGKKQKTIDFSEMLSVSGNICVCDIYADSGENLYVLYSVNSDVYLTKLDGNSDIISNNVVEGIFGENNQLVISEKGRFFVVNRGGAGMTLINEINPETCETIEYYEENTIGMILSGISDYDYLIYENDMFTGVKKDEEIYDELSEYSDYFVDSNIDVYNGKSVSFGVKYRYDSLLVKADKNTYEVISQEKIELEDNCYIIDSCYKNQEYVYLCGDNQMQFLILTDSDGKITGRKELDIDKSRYLSDVETDGKNIYILATENENSYCIKFDKNMDFASETEIANTRGNLKIIYADGDLYGYNESLYKIDCINRKAVKMDIDLRLTDVYSYNDTPVVKDEKGIVYTYDDGNISEIINTKEMTFLNSNQISTIKFIDENNFLVYSDITGKLQIVNKLDESQLKDISIINLACDSDNVELKNMISDFNAENTSTMIVLSDYSTEEKLEQLNIEIASGNVPDIIVSSGNMDLSIYENMGVLQDLTSYIENDDTINAEDYHTNIFRACSSQGKITQIVPYYTVITAVGKSSVLGEKMGWSYSEFSDFISENSGRDIFYSGWFRDGLMYNDIPYYAFSDFIDIKNEKISINEKFSELLSICNSYIGEEPDENSFYDKNELTDDFDMRFRNDNCLVEVMEIGSIDTLCALKDVIINEDIVLKGLPADNSNGSYVNPGLKVSMLTTCKEKDSAWKFIRRYLEDEYQKQIRGSYFPAKKDAFEFLYSECEETKYYLGDTVYDVHVPDKEYKNMISTWIESITDSICSENRLSNIILSELELYFGGQQNEEETIKELKRKIELYLSEV